MRMALMYRAERNKILKYQRMITKMAQYVVSYARQAVKDDIYRELVLRQTDLEYEDEKTQN